jgi:DNA-binding transcriptional ArsR family regulator
LDEVALTTSSVRVHGGVSAYISTEVRMYRGVRDDRCELLCLDLERAEALRRSRLSVRAAERLARAARALADPTRLTLAAALGEGGELCVCDVSWIAERPENLVSHHLRVLRSAGLAESRRDGKMVMYSLTDRGRALLRAAMTEGALRV